VPDSSEQKAADKVIAELIALRTCSPTIAIAGLNRLYGEVVGQVQPIPPGFPKLKDARPLTAMNILQLRQQIEREATSPAVDARWTETIDAAQSWSDAAV
jgi:hypothetical protein